MNLQLGQTGEALHNITNMKHLLQTVATISDFSSPSNVNHDGTVDDVFLFSLFITKFSKEFSSLSDDLESSSQGNKLSSRSSFK